MEGCLAVGNSTGEPWGHFTPWNKLVRKTSSVNELTHMWSLESLDLKSPREAQLLSPCGLQPKALQQEKPLQRALVVARAMAGDVGPRAELSVMRWVSSGGLMYSTATIIHVTLLYSWDLLIVDFVYPHYTQTPHTDIHTQRIITIGSEICVN